MLRRSSVVPGALLAIATQHISCTRRYASSSSSPIEIIHGYTTSQKTSRSAFPEAERAKLAETIGKVFSSSSPREQSKALTNKIQELKTELEPLRQQKMDIDAKVKRYPMIFLLGNLAFLTAQFGVLFNWVFFTFDWNLVEPITYFLGYSVVWMGVMFYNATGREFTYDATIEVLEERKRAKLYSKTCFDLAKFEALEMQLKDATVELSAIE